jgi:hypothetical protein
MTQDPAQKKLSSTFKFMAIGMLVVGGLNGVQYVSAQSNADERINSRTDEAHIYCLTRAAQESLSSQLNQGARALSFSINAQAPEIALCVEQTTKAVFEIEQAQRLTGAAMFGLMGGLGLLAAARIGRRPANAPRP